MMAKSCPIKFTFKRVEKSTNDKSDKLTVVTKTVKVDEAYKEFFASLLKIKDKDVQRRVLQAVNGQNLTCANCANKIEPKAMNQKYPQNRSQYSQTIDKDFEYLENVNRSSKTNGTINKATNGNECYILNKIQLGGRAKRKFEPYAVKAKEEKCDKSGKVNFLQYNNEPVQDSLLNKIRKPTVKTENKPIESTRKDCSITEKLLLDNLDIDQSMSPHGFFNFAANEPPSKLNDYIFVSTMEHEIRTAATSNEEGLYSIHIATINGDLFRLRRILVIYKYYKWDINIRSIDGRKESALHFAVTSVNNTRNNEIIDLLCDHGADVLATNDAGDTVLHLAAETIRDFGVITKLLSRISLADLSKKNDKSQTILHVAASNNNPTFVRSILNFIDDKLNILSIGRDVTFNDANSYFQQVDALHLHYVKTFINENFKKPTVSAVKAKLLNEQDGRSGKTAFFLALENNDQSTCLMLLAHFADTRIPDFSNTTCSFYSTEILKNRILAQAIYNADSMHNAVVVKTLKQTERHRNFESRKRAQLDVDKYDDDGDIMTKVAKVLS